MTSDRESVAETRSRLVGLIDPDDVRTFEVSRPPAALVERYLRLADLTPTLSDALDELGIGGAVAGHILAPIGPDQGRVCGPAVTIRYALAGGTPGDHRARGERARLADRDLYQIGRRGDVAVFDCGGFTGASVLGGLSASWARRVGIAACVVDGSVRDVAHVRRLGQPVWSRGRTPVTGRHRLEAVEINGAVELAGVQVRPGDLVAGDETGVCVIPATHAAEVLELAERADAGESRVEQMVLDGEPLEALAAVRPLETW